MSDLIDRQQAIDAILADAEWLASQGSDWQMERMERDCQILLFDVPTAQPNACENTCEIERKSNDCISRQAVLDVLSKAQVKTCEPMANYVVLDITTVVANLPSAQSEWNNHTVACLLAELFGDTCACNYNGIDEWLPEKCEVINACPNPVGVACWEQYLKHRAERRTDE